MKLKMLSLVVSCAIAGGTIPLCSAADAVIPAKQDFLDIRGSVKFNKEAVSSYFIRVDMPSVVEWQKRQASQGKKVTEQQRKSYIAKVRKELKKVIVQTEAAGFTAINPVVATDVGFSVKATREQADALSKKTRVKSVVPKRILDAQRTYSTRWVGGERAHVEYGLKGKGQTIAIIDSGIDYFHSDFLGSGNKDDYDGNDPAIIEPGTFPTPVVVDGYDFAGFDYDAGDSELSTPSPDPDPVDDGNHGSHVAGIAAGRSLGPDMATGIAPEADLYALKVFGAEGSTDLVSQAIEKAIDPNGDGDPEDAVDVINMSLGSLFGSPDAATAVSAQNAVEAGAVVVAAAGNSGNDIAYVSGSPASAPGVIAVASSLAGGVESFFLSFDAETGNDYDFFATYAAISPELDTRIEGALSVSEPFEACDALTNSFDGGIAVISRGSCAFTTKLENALAAGASAAVVINNEPGAPFAMGGTDVTLPAAMISQAEGALLLAELNSSAIAGEFAASNTRANTIDDDTISDFSSRGPGATGLFKPDVAAPGDEIESALAGSGRETLTISGTSMAAPQVAGMAALLREKFPELGPDAIKAIIQNSARPAKLLGQVGSPPLSLQGTGIIDIEKALNSTAYAMPGGLGFGSFKPEYNDAMTQWVEVTNFSDKDQRFKVSVEENTGAGSAGITVEVSQEIYVAAGQSARLPVTLRMQSNALQGEADALGEYDGWVVFESAEASLRVGYMALIEPASSVNISRQGDEFKLRNVAFGDATVLGFTQTDVNARDSNLGSSLGYRSVSEESVAFAFNAPQDWTHFSQYVLTMNIDVNEDGQPDFRAIVGDLNALDPENNRSTTGTVASGIDNLATGSRNLLYVADVETNSSVLQYQLDAYGDFGFLAEGDTTFDYTLTLRNRFNGDGEAVYMGSGSVDLARQVSFDFPGIILPAQDGAQLQVGGQGVPMLVIPTENEPAKRVKLVR
ncbi:S8 family serine peptidase [Marinagarivorans algicola]|uniref:S8 family serine peptidase n=1 Tax=Marinagarivorans algicola TaxID=1513270 RepID=UPI0006B93087|nr:S8 family serine peptidase [Marinagarivorans algicola]